MKKKIFLASSSELKNDRQEFEIFINRKNKEWYDKGIFLDLIVWEDFLDAISQTRLQDEYNQAIKDSDIFIMLYFTKVGKYTEEEFKTAFGHFKETNKPFIFTYFKDADINISIASRTDLQSLWVFQDKLKELGHFYTVYTSIEDLRLKFTQQLEKLVANGFIEFSKQNQEAREKNIAEKDIERVKKISIGDKEITSNETFDKKNIVKGNVKDANEFTLGDGH